MKVTAVDFGQSVVPREALIDHRVIRMQEIQHAVILPQHFPKEGDRLTLHRFFQFGIELGIDRLFDVQKIEELQAEPLSHEVFGETLAPRIRQHSLRLGEQHRRIVQLPLRRQARERLVGRTTPEEHGQPRRQFVIRQPRDASAFRIFLDEIEEFRRG